MENNTFNSRQFYDEFADSFEDYSMFKIIYLDSIDDIISGINFSPRKMIDLGAGDGRRSLKIGKRLGIKDVVLVDESQEMLDVGYKDGFFRKINADISDLSFSFGNDYDLVLCLWNVFGHVEGNHKRLNILKNIFNITSPNAVIFLDVNNRYNMSQYGFLNVIKNILKDLFIRGNSRFVFSVDKNGREIKTSVYIFNPFELDYLIKGSGLKIVEKSFINYQTGKPTNNIFSGQILYKLCKK